MKQREQDNMNNFNDPKNPNQGENMKTLNDNPFNSALKEQLENHDLRKELQEPEVKRKYKRKDPPHISSILDMSLLEITEENLPLKQVKPFNLQIDKKIIYAFKFEFKSFEKISQELALSFAYINSCLKRHKVTQYDRHPVLAAKIANLTNKGFSYVEIQKKLGVSTGTVVRIKNRFNLTKAKKKDLVVRHKKAEPKMVKPFNEKKIVLSSMDFSEIEKIYKTTKDPKVKALAKQKMKLIFECL